MGSRAKFTIAQLSDIHCGDPRFESDLARGCIDGINDANPDIVIVPGDLTANGYLDEFEAAQSELAKLRCPERIVVPGNHDERNVGWTLYERVIGERSFIADLEFGVKHGGKVQERIRVVAADSAKPDLNDGSLGRTSYDWIVDAFEGSEDSFRVFVLHHHLVSVPGTGRERNIVLDAGDALELLLKCGVDLVVAGHKHVPYVWDVNGMLIVGH